MSLTDTRDESLANRATPQFVQAGEPYRFKPGQSGNPNGRPRKIEKATDTAVDSLQKAIERAASLVDNEDPRIALAAAQLIIDRAMGKPKQTVENVESKKVNEMTEEEILDRLRAAATQRTLTQETGAEQPH